MEPTLSEFAFAKLNLFLEVIGKRPDGYHDLETVMHEIDLADRVTLRRRDEGVILRTDAPDLGNGEDNLAVRAVRALERHVGHSLPCEIGLEKRIPVGGGLGGGSSDAATVMRLLNRAFGLRLTDGTLEAVAGTFGSDIAFFIRGGTALCRGRGEIVEPLPGIPRLSFLLVLPEVHVPTPMVFKSLRLTGEIVEGYDLRRSLSLGSVAGLRRHAFNRLEGPARSLFPVLDARLSGLSPHRARLSGSGSTIFIPCVDDDEAQRLKSTLEASAGERLVVAASASR